VGGTKQQSTKSYSRKCGNGGGRGNRGGSNRFDIGIGNDDRRDDSNGKGNGDDDSGNGYSGNNDSNSNSGSGNSNSGRKNNNELKLQWKKQQWRSMQPLSQPF
jgi:hypothetical protein